MAIKANLVIDQGSTFSATIDVIDASGQTFDLSSYVVTAQMRKNYASSSAVNFTAAQNGLLGQITLSLLHTATAALEPGRYLYDVEITSNAGAVTRVVEGIATVTPGITRV